MKAISKGYAVNRRPWELSKTDEGLEGNDLPRWRIQSRQYIGDRAMWHNRGTSTITEY
jgi:hypothetical protein